ncbi:MAG: tetratricopeptide repeat protein, partial [Armatimonadota bacterium]
TVTYERGEYAESRSFYQESLALCRRLGHGVGIAITLINLGGVARSDGDYGTARTLYREGLAVARGLGHKPVIAGALRNLGD